MEDTEFDAVLVCLALTQAGYDVYSRRVDTAMELREELNTGEWDLVIAEYTMRGFTGIKALNIVRERHADVPFIFVSAPSAKTVPSPPCEPARTTTSPRATWRGWRRPWSANCARVRCAASGTSRTSAWPTSRITTR